MDCSKTLPTGVEQIYKIVLHEILFTIFTFLQSIKFVRVTLLNHDVLIL